jgi:hypothetical protein
MTVNASSTSSPEIPCLPWNEQLVATANGMSVKRVQELANSKGPQVNLEHVGQKPQD